MTLIAGCNSSTPQNTANTTLPPTPPVNSGLICQGPSGSPAYPALAVPGQPMCPPGYNPVPAYAATGPVVSPPNMPASMAPDSSTSTSGYYTQSTSTPPIPNASAPSGNVYPGGGGYGSNYPSYYGGNSYMGGYGYGMGGYPPGYGYGGYGGYGMGGMGGMFGMAMGLLALSDLGRGGYYGGYGGSNVFLGGPGFNGGGIYRPYWGGNDDRNFYVNNHQFYDVNRNNFEGFGRSAMPMMYRGNNFRPYHEDFHGGEIGHMENHDFRGGEIRGGDFGRNEFHGGEFRGGEEHRR